MILTPVRKLTSKSLILAQIKSWIQDRHIWQPPRPPVSLMGHSNFLHALLLCFLLETPKSLSRLPCHSLGSLTADGPCWLCLCSPAPFLSSIPTTLYLITHLVLIAPLSYNICLLAFCLSGAPKITPPPQLFHVAPRGAFQNPNLIMLTGCLKCFGVYSLFGGKATQSKIWPQSSFPASCVAIPPSACGSQTGGVIQPLHLCSPVPAAREPGLILHLLSAHTVPYVGSLPCFPGRIKHTLFYSPTHFCYFPLTAIFTFLSTFPIN